MSFPQRAGPCDRRRRPLLEASGNSNARRYLANSAGPKEHEGRTRGRAAKCRPCSGGWPARSPSTTHADVRRAPARLPMRHPIRTSAAAGSPWLRREFGAEGGRTSSSGLLSIEISTASAGLRRASQSSRRSKNRLSMSRPGRFATRPTAATQCLCINIPSSCHQLGQSAVASVAAALLRPVSPAQARAVTARGSAHLRQPVSSVRRRPCPWRRPPRGSARPY